MGEGITRFLNLLTPTKLQWQILNQTYGWLDSNSVIHNHNHKCQTVDLHNGPKMPKMCLFCDRRRCQAGHLQVRKHHRRQPDRITRAVPAERSGPEERVFHPESIAGPRGAEVAEAHRSRPVHHEALLAAGVHPVKDPDGLELG